MIIPISSVSLGSTEILAAGTDVKVGIREKFKKNISLGNINVRSQILAFPTRNIYCFNSYRKACGCIKISLLTVTTTRSSEFRVAAAKPAFL